MREGLKRKSFCRSLSEVEVRQKIVALARKKRSFDEGTERSSPGPTEWDTPQNETKNFLHHIKMITQYSVTKKC